MLAKEKEQRCFAEPVLSEVEELNMTVLLVKRGLTLQATFSPATTRLPIL
jgi:hypothetical protein